MLVRIGASGVAWWEIPFTIALMIVAIFVCTVISARIYRFGVLMYGQRPGTTGETCANEIMVLSLIQRLLFESQAR